jgi:cytochrome P450
MVAQGLYAKQPFFCRVLIDHPRIGMGHLIGFTPHGPTWRHLRREFHINFLPTRLQAFRPVERRAVHRLLRNLLVSPENFSQHLRQ